MARQDSELEQLQDEWKEMFQETLPAAATSKSPSQSKWRVHVDHCFARIILDSIVGIDAPWMEKIKSPAYKNMSRDQLERSIELGRKILGSEVDLVQLDNRSLELRAKRKKGSGETSGKVDENAGATLENDAKKRKLGEEAEVEKDAKKRKSADDSKSGLVPPEDFTPWLKKIALSDKSQFQKKVLTALCQVPRGRYTTYAAISKHLSSSPRAVGNALRNNPFAPQVPCHRVLASGGGLGGFHGSWGRNGKEGLHDDKKRKLLREEGVRFDGKGRVVGSAWEGFS